MSRPNPDVADLTDSNNLLTGPPTAREGATDVPARPGLRVRSGVRAGKGGTTTGNINVSGG